MKEKQIAFIGAVLIIILGFAVYANSLNGKFIWDDIFLVKNNLYIRHWSSTPKIFTKDWGRGAGIEFPFYRPLSIFTYLLNYSLGGLDVRWYHLTNIILHILASLALYRFITLLYDDRLLALLAGIFFVIHPVHTEAVAYISGRPDSLALLFLLLTFIFYIKYLRVENPLFSVLALLSYVLALLSKENSLILPALILLYHYTFRKKIKIGGFVPLLSIFCAYIILRLTVLRFAQESAFSLSAVFRRIPGFFAAITSYIRLLIFPFGLHMEYGDKIFSFGDIRVITGAIALVSLLIYAFKKRNENNLVFFSVFWFFIALLPVSNLYPLPFYMAEHYLYLPSIGFFLILSKGISSIYGTEKFRIFAIGAIICLTFFYSFLTIRQNNYWRRPIGFYKRTLEYTPDSARAYCNLGVAQRAIGRRKEAIESYKKALEIRPNYAKVYYSLGNVFCDIGRTEEAITFFKKALELSPGDADVYNNLGIVYSVTGRKEDAIASFEKAIELNPDLPNPYYNLGVIYSDIGKKEEAKGAYKKARELGLAAKD